MKKLSFHKFIYIISAIFAGSLFVFSVVHAASYISLSASFSQPSVASSNGFQVYDLDPGDFLTVTGTLIWRAGFARPLPAMGIGVPKLGYILSNDPLTCFASSNYLGHTQGNSVGSGGKICEIAFDTANADTGMAIYTIYVDANAPRGRSYFLGLTSNGGSNFVEEDFYIRIKPKVNSFTCSSGTLAWDTLGYSNFSVKNSSNNTIASSPTGSIANIPNGLYTLNEDNTLVTSSNCDYTPPLPALSAQWTSNNSISQTISVAPGQQITIPFYFWNSGQSGSQVNVTGCTEIHTSGVGILVDRLDCFPQNLNN